MTRVSIPTPTTVENLTLSGNVYDIFAESIRSKVTRFNYVYALKKYMLYRNVTRLEELLPKSPNPSSIDIRSIEIDIINYIVHLKNIDKLAYGTIHNYMIAVEHFYTICGDLSLNRKKISRYLPEPKKMSEDRGYTRDEIAKMLEGSDNRLTALILLLSSTGIRIGGVSDLQLKHLTKTKMPIPEHNSSSSSLYKIVVYAGCKEEYFCFVTPETARGLDAYLQYRERYGEKLTPASYLFREQFNITDIFDCKNPRQMDPKGLSRLIAGAAARSGVMEQRQAMLEGEKLGKRRYKVFVTHGFRKWFTNRLVAAGVNRFSITKLLSHSSAATGITGKHYYRPDEQELLNEYLKAVDFLTIDESNRLKREVETLKIRKSELEEMKEMLEEQQAQIYRLSSKYDNDNNK